MSVWCLMNLMIRYTGYAIRFSKSTFSASGCFFCKFNCFQRSDIKVLHIRKELNDETPDILDMLKINQHEITVNCRG